MHSTTNPFEHQFFAFPFDPEPLFEIEEEEEELTPLEQLFCAMSTWKVKSLKIDGIEIEMR